MLTGKTKALVDDTVESPRITSKAEAAASAMWDYSVLVIDPGQGGLAEQARMALGKQGKRILVSVMADSGQIPADAPYQAVILPLSAAMHPPEGLKAWLENFGGRQIILPDEAGGALLAGDAREAARMTQQLAGGHEAASGGRATQPGWMIVVYVFAALFALQLLFGLLVLGISTIVRF